MAETPADLPTDLPTDLPADLVSAVGRAARRWGDRVAWRFDPGPSLTFDDVDRATRAWAAALRDEGVRAGDRVALMLRNGPQFPLAWLALARVGAAAVPLNVRYGTVDAGHVLRDAAVTAVVTTDEHADLVRAAAPGVRVLDATAVAATVLGVRTPRTQPGEDARGPVDAATVLNVQYTSGTTGPPKGCLLSHRYWTTLAGSLVTQFPHLGPDDVMLTAQPFSYVDPQWNVAAGLLSGAELVVLDGFHPSTFWARVREHAVTYVYCLGAMPTLLHRMPPDPGDHDHRVRVVQCSGIPRGLHADLETRFGAPWFEAFGMTETGADLRVGPQEHDELVGTGCLGRPAAHRQVRVVDGELQLRGPGMFDGYLGHPPALDDDGWFATGDLARLDDQDRVYLQGRRKDMIRRSGENVAAAEVEEVLLSHPGVQVVAVVGVPDDVRGEEVMAFYVGTATAAELAGHCAGRLAPFKVPSRWEVRADLPRTPSERVAKHLLVPGGGS